MNEDLHQIDDLFKSGLEGKEENPSPSVWNNIEKELDKKDSRPKFLYWWNTRRTAAAVLILLGSAGLFAGGYYFGVRQDKQQVPSAEQKQPETSGTRAADAEPAFTEPTVKDQAFADRAGNENDKKTSSNSSGTATGNSTHTIPGQQTTQDSKGEVTIDAEEETKTITQDKNRSERSSAPTVKENVSTGGLSEKTGKPAPQTFDRGGNASRHEYQKNDQQATLVATEKDAQVAELPATGRDAQVEEFLAPGRTREQEQIAASPERAIAGVRKQIPVAPPVSTPLPEHSTSSKSIPVLNKRKTEVDLPRFSLTPVAGLQFGSNKIVANNDPHSRYIKTDIDRTESQPMSINGGILADLKIARNITLQSGLIFASRNIEIEPKYIKAERNPDGKVRYKFECSAGTYYIKKSTYARPGDSAMTIFSTNELNYVNIPLALTYHFGGKKLHLFATAGAGINLLTDHYLETGLKNYNYDANESIATNLKSSYFNGMIGAGILYRPFRKISFLFNPQYQFAVTPMNENMPVKAYPRIFTMQAGMQIRL